MSTTIDPFLAGEKPVNPSAEKWRGAVLQSFAAYIAQIGRKNERIKNPPVGGAATHRGRTT